jgi:uncharacterized protein YjbJ (UPF0337 family)
MRALERRGAGVLSAGRIRVRSAGRQFMATRSTGCDPGRAGNFNEETKMDGKFDDVKGRAKEAVGDLTDDDDLKREGKTDQAVGSIKDKLEDAKDWVEDKVDDVKDRLKRDS